MLSTATIIDVIILLSYSGTALSASGIPVLQLLLYGINNWIRVLLLMTCEGPRTGCAKM
jgi:hypothetical protein